MLNSKARICKMKSVLSTIEMPNVSMLQAIRYDIEEAAQLSWAE
jgi:hypothetical protein